MAAEQTRRGRSSAQTTGAWEAVVDPRGTPARPTSRGYTSCSRETKCWGPLDLLKNVCQTESKVTLFFGTARMGLPFAETLKVTGRVSLSFTLDIFSFEKSIY